MRSKYYYNGVTLYRYCKENQLSYDCVAYRCRKFLNQSNLSIEEAIDTAVNIQIYRNKDKLVKSGYRELEKEQKNYKHICEILNIDYNCVYRLKFKGYNKDEIIKIIWFFSRDYNKHGNKKMKVTELEKIESKDIEEDIYNLIALYRCGKIELLETIIEYQKPFLLKKVLKLVSLYNIKIDEEKKDELLAEAIFLFLEIIDNIMLNNAGKIITYINICITGRLKKFIAANYLHRIEFDESFMFEKKYVEDFLW